MCYKECESHKHYSSFIPTNEEQNTTNKYFISIYGINIFLNNMNDRRANVAKQG